MNNPDHNPTKIDRKRFEGVYYPWHDWLRAICACSVMLYHDSALRWAHTGQFAVDVFFALSGWLIAGILLNSDKADLTRFYFNRAIRIWIPYYIAVLFLLILSIAREPVTAKWIEIVIYKLTFVYNLFGLPQLAEFHKAMPQQGTLSHVWSVNSKEQFYLLAPLLLVLSSKFLGRSFLVWFCLAAVAWITNTYAAIVFGVTAAVCAHRYGAIHLTSLGRTTVIMVCITLLTLLALDVNYSSVAPFAAISIVLMLSIPGRQHSFGKIFGGMSYPLYLNHWVGVFAFNYLMPGMRDSLLRQGLAAIANVGFAILLYWFIDRKLLEVRSDWYTPTRGKWVTICAYLMVMVGLVYGFFMLAV